MFIKRCNGRQTKHITEIFVPPFFFGAGHAKKEFAEPSKANALSPTDIDLQDKAVIYIIMPTVVSNKIPR